MTYYLFCYVTEDTYRHTHIIQSCLFVDCDKKRYNIAVGSFIMLINKHKRTTRLENV